MSILAAVCVALYENESTRDLRIGWRKRQENRFVGQLVVVG